MVRKRAKRFPFLYWEKARGEWMVHVPSLSKGEASLFVCRVKGERVDAVIRQNVFMKEIHGGLRVLQGSKGLKRWAGSCRLSLAMRERRRRVEALEAHEALATAPPHDDEPVRESDDAMDKLFRTLEEDEG